jgi:hypothetical protein
MKRIAGDMFIPPAYPIAHRRRQEENFHSVVPLWFVDTFY